MAITGREGTSVYECAQMNKHAPSARLLLPPGVPPCVLQQLKNNIFEPISFSGSWRKARWSRDRRRSTKATSDFETLVDTCCNRFMAFERVTVKHFWICPHLCRGKIMWLYFISTLDWDSDICSCFLLVNFIYREGWYICFYFFIFQRHF